AVKRAIDSDSGTLAGPVGLVQGGEGLVYRRPLWISGNYWGLLSTVVDSPSLLAAAMRDLPDAGHQFAIRGRDGLGSNGGVFSGDSALFDYPDAVKVEMAVPNGTWMVAVSPRAEVAGAGFAVVMRVMGWGLALLLAS